jgi:hypothetical protein
MEVAIRKADKAINTYKCRNRATGPTTARKRPLYKVEVGPVPLSILDRRAGRYNSLTKSKTGIPVYESGKYHVDIVNNVYLACTYAYQQCYYAYRYGSTDSESLKIAKHFYYSLQRNLSRWNKILCSSNVVQRYWRVISMTFRIAKSDTKCRG